MKRTGLVLVMFALLASVCAQESATPPSPESQPQQQPPVAQSTAIPEAQAPAQQPAPEPQAPAQQPPTEQPSAPAAQAPAEQPAQQPPAESKPEPAQQPAAPPPTSMQESVQEPLPPAPVQPQIAKTNIVERVPGPTDPDIYCAGYITNRRLPERQYVAAGWGSPHQTKYTDGEYVYLSGGSFQEGAMYEIVRKLRDPNRWEMYAGQRGAIANAGQPYAQVAQVKVIGVRRNIAITQVKFSCEPAVPGDLAIPLVERPRPEFKPDPNFDRFAPANGKLTGRIIMARDFDSLLGHGRIAYLNIGANKGVKVGDYFHTTRTYSSTLDTPIDALSLKASFNEDTQENPREFGRYDQLPRRTLGTMLILNVTPKSAAGLVTFALEDIQVGDRVEMFEPPPAPLRAAEPMNPPLISCTAVPTTVHVGETATIICDANSPDNRPLSLSFSSTGGQLLPRNNTARLDTAQLQPGTVTVTGTATDDRNLSASAPATVTVEAVAAPTTPTSQELTFTPSSPRVDNRAKAILDGVALQLQQQADATAIVVGYADPSERDAQTLAQRRATNVVDYLVQSKGIDAGRISTRVGTDAAKRGVVVWVVPAGVAPPQ